MTPDRSLEISGLRGGEYPSSNNNWSSGLLLMNSPLAAMVLATLLAWTPEAGATLIVTYRSSDEVIIAADSLRTIKTAPPVHIRACKIRNFGDVVFAAAGASTLPGQGFSIRAISANLHERNRSGPETLRDQITRFDERTITAFKKLHEQRKKTYPVTFTYIVAFSLEGRPVAHLRTLKSASGTVEIGRWETVAEDEVVFTGQSEIADHLSGVSKPNDSAPAALLEAVIEHQARRTPKKVGQPIDIIRLTGDGVTWLQRKTECRERE